MTAEHDKCKSTQVGMSKRNATTNPMQTKHAYKESSLNTHTWPHLQELNHIEKLQNTNTGGSGTRAGCPYTSSRACPGTRGFPRQPTARTHTRHRVPALARRGSGGSRRSGGAGPGGGEQGPVGRERGAGPGLGARGGDEGRARGGARLTWAGGSS